MRDLLKQAHHVVLARYGDLHGLPALGARKLRRRVAVLGHSKVSVAGVDPLAAIDWRLERADEHLAALNRERDIFLDEKNRLLLGQFERDTSEYVLRFGGKLPDPRVGLIVGEFAHHLRAAFDNLIWQLVLARGGSPTSRTQFPIYESRKRYEDADTRMLRGIGSDDRAVIEAIQPFHEGERAADSHFAQLAWLSNVDKHRFVHIGCARARTFGVPVRYGEGPSTGELPWNPQIIGDVAQILGVTYVPPLASDDRTELMRVRLIPSGPHPEVKVDSRAPLEIAFGDAQHSLVIGELAHIRESIVAVIEGLRPRLNVVGWSP